MFLNIPATPISRSLIHIQPEGQIECGKSIESGHPCNLCDFHCMVGNEQVQGISDPVIVDELAEVPPRTDVHGPRNVNLVAEYTLGHIRDVQVMVQIWLFLLKVSHKAFKNLH